MKTILLFGVGREYDFTVEVDSSSGAKKMLKVEPYHALSSNEQVKSKFRYVFGRIDSYIPYKMAFMGAIVGYCRRLLFDVKYWPLIQKNKTLFNYRIE